MILLSAIAIGLTAGWVWAFWHGNPYQAPELHHFWLAFAAFLPQFVAIQFSVPDPLAAVSLLGSQALLLGFAWLNRRIPGMMVLICGAALNLTVMVANRGFMPINPQTAGRLVPEEVLLDFQPGSRIGPKDILLSPEDTRFEWLADRFLPPAWFPYQVAFSLGDVFIAIGVFWMLARTESSIHFLNRGMQT